MTTQAGPLSCPPPPPSCFDRALKDCLNLLHRIDDIYDEVLNELLDWDHQPEEVEFFQQSYNSYTDQHEALVAEVDMSRYLPPYPPFTEREIETEWQGPEVWPRYTPSRELTETDLQRNAQLWEEFLVLVNHVHSIVPRLMPLCPPFTHEDDETWIAWKYMVEQTNWMVGGLHDWLGLGYVKLPWPEEPVNGVEHMDEDGDGDEEMS